MALGVGGEPEPGSWLEVSVFAGPCLRLRVCLCVDVR